MVPTWRARGYRTARRRFRFGAGGVAALRQSSLRGRIRGVSPAECLGTPVPESVRFAYVRMALLRNASYKLAW